MGHLINRFVNKLSKPKREFEEFALSHLLAESRVRRIDFWLGKIDRDTNQHEVSFTLLLEEGQWFVNSSLGLTAARASNFIKMINSLTAGQLASYIYVQDVASYSYTLEEPNPYNYNDGVAE